MPQLRSGRHFALHSPWLEGLTTGKDEEKFSRMLWYRMHVRSPEQLRDNLLVIYFREGEGAPPDAPRYSSGFYVVDVLQGKAGWTEDEVAEMRTWLAQDARVAAWTAAEFEKIHRRSWRIRCGSRI
jgi:hypothetical protein